MNLAVCLAGCLDVTPLKSLLQVVPSWFKAILNVDFRVLFIVLVNS